MTDDALAGPITEENGVRVYANHTTSSRRQTLTVVCHLAVGSSHLSPLEESAGAATLAAIETVGLEPFDFRAEVAAVTARLRREAAARGEKYTLPAARDGGKLEIVIRTSRGTFRLEEWNPRTTIFALAPHSPQIAKLKAVIEILERHLGGEKLVN